MIAIIDYGMGNLRSVEKAFAKLGTEAVITRTPAEIARAEKVVLPGVGAFGDCMHNLRQYDLISVIQEVVAAQTPFLGICLGLQVMFEGSEEDPGIAGLGIFRGMVKKIAAPELKIPHMGWNSLNFASPSPLLANLPANPYVYFVHSYHAVPEEAGIITASTPYGEAVTAAVGRGPVQAMQFHPEKSGAVGMQILRNFKELSA